MDRRLFLLTALALLGVSACGSVPPLSNAYDSPDDLAKAVLDALARADRARLEQLALNEREFRDHVWPQLPAARPERNLPLSYVWGDLHQKSEQTLQRTLARYGGRRLELVNVTFERESDYTTYRVHRETTFTVRDASAAQSTIRVCGSMFEKDGAWKVFSYMVDE